jgi:23S rRNA (guanosine2251-2'-O)-methyltransferase
VVLPRHRSARVTPAVTKAAAGAIEYLPIASVAGIPAMLDRASRKGVWSVGLDEDGSQSLFDLNLTDQPIVLVLGAEGRGLARLTRDRCDVLAHIPMRGRVASLNVAAAAALACHEVARHRSV